MRDMGLQGDLSDMKEEKSDVPFGTQVSCVPHTSMGHQGIGPRAWRREGRLSCGEQPEVMFLLLGDLDEWKQQHDCSTSTPHVCSEVR